MYETSLLPNRFTTLVEGKRSGAVRRFYARRTDFSALDGDAFLAVVGCRGLQSFQAQRSVFPSGCVVDDLIRSCAANGVLELHFRENRCEPALRFSDDAVLDFCYQTNAAPVRRPISLELDVIGVSDLFLAKFFEVCLPCKIKLNQKNSDLRLYGGFASVGSLEEWIPTSSPKGFIRRTSSAPCQ